MHSLNHYTYKSTHLSSQNVGFSIGFCEPVLDPSRLLKLFAVFYILLNGAVVAGAIGMGMGALMQSRISLFDHAKSSVYEDAETKKITVMSFLKYIYSEVS
jgi:hypothetical protein